MNGIFGSVFGNIAATLFFLYFQIFGIAAVRFLLKEKEEAVCLLAGSVLGSVCMQWFPALAAFFLDFTVAAHLAAIGLSLCLLAVLFLCRLPYKPFRKPAAGRIKEILSENRLFLLMGLFTFLLFAFLLYTHTLLPGKEGLYAGQSTYGDMSMHLGFITSIAVQHTFPPYYSISPGNLLCYPFLCDSNSSSLYLFGASLRYAYCLPMLFAFVQVMCGFYFFAGAWLKEAAKAAVAFLLFFYNGGLGFLYFIDFNERQFYRFSDIFTGYYTTPTNLIDNNIRWVNIIADMLLPQRATLFGYAVLFPCIWFLFRAVYRKERVFFLLTGILVGALPMIHTHSFLAMACISAAWLLMYVVKDFLSESCWGSLPGVLFFGMLILMCTLQSINGPEGMISKEALLVFCIFGLLLLLLTGLGYLIRYLRKYGFDNGLQGFAVYLVIVLAAALPQLFYWTFSQASGSGFNNGHFNWANLGDNYIWFYVKNFGVIVFLMAPALIKCGKKAFTLVSASYVIWFVAELIAFSPNTYDNNKLFYVGYVFLVCLSVEYGSRLLHRLGNLVCKPFVVGVFLFLCTFSAVLSLGREAVSNYLVYSKDQLAVADFIENNTEKNATFLTNGRHVNEVAALTGRNIVLGSGIYLSPHGIYDGIRAQDVGRMYESPGDAGELFLQYDVDYMIVSDWERNDYQLNEEMLDGMFPTVFESGSIKIYGVTNKSRSSK